MKFSQFLKEKELSIPKDAPSVETIAKKHGVSVEYVKKQLEVGIKVESEHSKNKGVEREIALDHLNEKPDYYKKLKKYVEEVEQLDELSPATIASYKQKAKEQIPALMKHSKTGEYKDIAKNILKRRLKGMSRASISEGENKEMKGKDPCWKGYQMVGMKNKGGKKVPNCVPEEVEHLDELSNELLGRYKDAAVVSHNKAETEKNYKLSDKRFSGVVKATNKQFANTRKKYAKEETEKDKAPFEGGKKSKGTVVDKSGAKHTSMSRARDLARKAMKQVSDKKMKTESIYQPPSAEIEAEIARRERQYQRHLAQKKRQQKHHPKPKRSDDYEVPAWHSVKRYGKSGW